MTSMEQHKKKKKEKKFLAADFQCYREDVFSGLKLLYLDLHGWSSCAIFLHNLQVCNTFLPSKNTQEDQGFNFHLI